MKMKCLAALLVVLLLATGCVGNTPHQTDPTVQSISVDGITVTVLGMDNTENNCVLEVQWKNESPYFVTYGEMFSLQVFDGSTWVYCETVTEPVFHTIGYGLEAGKTTVAFYPITWLYGDLTPGQYRFLTSCSASVNGKNESVSLSADFTLEEETPETNEPYGVYTEPPKLNISGVADAVLGGYSWSYFLYDNTWTQKIADARHPLAIAEDLEIINLNTNRAEFFFEDWPDDITVRCYLVDSHVETSQAVLVWNNSIQLKDNNYVYEVTAVWNDDGEGYYGTATYVFYPGYPQARGYDVMPAK